MAENRPYFSIDDLQDIYEAMFDARAQWRNIGGAFHVPNGDLSALAQDERDAEGKLRSVIETWLNHHGGTEICTWAEVANVLENKTVGCGDMARELRRERGVARVDPKQNQRSGAVELELSTFLHENNLVQTYKALLYIYIALIFPYSSQRPSLGVCLSAKPLKGRHQNFGNVTGTEFRHCGKPV